MALQPSLGWAFRLTCWGTHAVCWCSCFDVVTAVTAPVWILKRSFSLSGYTIGELPSWSFMGLGRRLADAVLEREVRKEVAKKDIYLWDRESSSCITKSNNNKTLDTSERKRFLGCCMGSDRDEWLCLPGLLQEMPKGEGLPSQVISPIGSCALRWFFLWHRSFVWMLKRWTGLQLHQSADDRKLFSHFIQHRRVCISCFSIWGLGIGKLSLALRQTGVMLVRGESL